MKQIIFFLVFVLFNVSQAYLKVNGKHLYYGDKKVFLSGANIAWNELGNDWGNGKYFEHRAKMNEWLAGIHNNGGNVARVWLHCWGAQSPAMDQNGYIVGTDHKNSLVSELQALMDDAQKHNVFIILCMFCTSIFKTNNGFIYDDSKIQSYIDKALKPMVGGLAHKKAFAAWELMNEPEGGYDVWHKDADTDPCFDLASHFKDSNSHMGFELKYPVKNILKFFNHLTDAIHTMDSSALVSIGTWNWKTGSNKCWGCFDLYSDHCMIKAGGKQKGTLDFIQMHSYEWSNETPIKVNADFYGLSKPLLVGEFSVKRSGTSDAAAVYKHYYFSGYAGAMAWQYNDHHDDDRDSREVIDHGMQAIRNENSNGEITITI